MSEADFCFTFPDLIDAYSQVLYRDNSRNLEYAFGFRIEDAHVSSVRTNPEQGIAFDLIDLAAALYISDWLAPRSMEVPSRFHLVIPLRYPEVFSEQDVFEALQHLLYWYTEDYWNFEFKLRVSVGRLSERRRRLLSARHQDVALWSGGLDSLAGLCSHWCSTPLPAGQLLIGTGGNDYAYSRQSVLAKAVEQKLSANIELVRLRISPRKIGQIAKHNAFRVRGLVFVLIGLATAFLEGHNKLSVYENGIGALNLPLSKAEIGLAHARSVHPRSLHLIRHLGEIVLGQKVDVYNPFLFSTKAQICEVFVEHPELAVLIDQTITCDRPPRLPKLKHCGCCTSCLLRRQALAVLGIRDNTHYAVYRSDYDADHRYRHLPAMIEQVRSFRRLLATNDPWGALMGSFPQLYEVRALFSDDVSVNLIGLLHQYSSEWALIGDTLDLNPSS